MKKNATFIFQMADSQLKTYILMSSKVTKNVHGARRFRLAFFWFLSIFLIKSPIW